MANKHFSERPISLAEQVIEMRRYFPDFRTHWCRNVVRWVGELQPRGISQRYRVKIIHQLYENPAVYVLNPPLVPGQDGEIPHTYPGNRLCLFYPKRQEWSQHMVVAETIVPWICLWLSYYECWQATGEWLGGGEHLALKGRRKSPLQLASSLGSSGR